MNGTKRKNHITEQHMVKNDNWQITAGQIRALNNVAQRMSGQLAGIPELSDENFDGWFIIYNG